MSPGRFQVEATAVPVFYFCFSVNADNITCYFLKYLIISPSFDISYTKVSILKMFLSSRLSSCIL